MGDFTYSLGPSRSLDYFDGAVVPGASVDCGDALQDACDAIAAGEIGEIVGYGTYYIETPVVMDDPALLRMRALGSSGALLGPGSWNFNVVGAITGLKLGQDSGTSVWRGPVLDNVSFIDDTPGTATGGLHMIRCNTWVLNKPYFGEFSSGFGLMLDGGTDSIQYGTIINAQGDRNQIGLKFRKSVEDITIINSRFDGNSTVDEPASYGIAPDGTDGGWGRWAVMSLSVHNHLVGADFTGLRRSWINMAAEQRAAIQKHGTAAIINGWENAAPDGSTDQGWQNRINLSAYGHVTGLSIGAYADDTEYRVMPNNVTTPVSNSGSTPGVTVKSANW